MNFTTSWSLSRLLLVGPVWISLMGKVESLMPSAHADITRSGGEGSKIILENFSPSENRNEVEFFGVRDKIYALEKDQQVFQMNSQGLGSMLLTFRASPRSFQSGITSVGSAANLEVEGTSKVIFGNGKVVFDRNAFKKHLEQEDQVEHELQHINKIIHISNENGFEQHLGEWDIGIEQRLTSLLKCLLDYETSSLIQGRPFVDWLAEAKTQIWRRRSQVREKLRVDMADGDFLDEMTFVEAYHDAVFGHYSRLVFLILEEASSHYKLDMTGFTIPPVWFSSLLADHRLAVSNRTEALKALRCGDLTRAKISLDKATETSEGIQKLLKRLLAWGIIPPDTLSDPFYESTLRLWDNAKKLDRGLPSFDGLELELGELAERRAELEEPRNPGPKVSYRIEDNPLQEDSEEKIKEEIQYAVEAYKHELQAQLALRAKDRVTALWELSLARESHLWLQSGRSPWVDPPDLGLKQEPSYIAVHEAYEKALKGKAAQTS